MIDNNKNIRYMNMKKNLLMLFCAVALFVSCTTEEQEQIAASNGTAVSISSAEIPPVGGEVNFTISANVTWRIASKPNWINLSKTAGSSGTARIRLNADLNTDGEDRSGSIVIAASDGSWRESIEVFQEHPYLYVSKNEIDFLWDETKAFSTPNESINVECNTEWAIYVVNNSNGTHFDFTDNNGMSQYDWMLCSSISGENNAVLEFNPALYNIELAPHSMRLQLASLDRDGHTILSQNLDFTQANLRFLVDVLDSDDDENLAYKACYTEDQTIEIDSELNWFVQNAPSWVTISQRNGTGNQSAQSVINIDGANPTANIRTGDIVLAADAGTSPLPTRTIHVSQNGYVFNVDYSTFTADSWDYTTTEMPVYSSGAWQIDASSVPAWLNVPVRSGVGDELSGEMVTVEPTGQNFALTNREANILFKSTQPGNNMTVTKKYIQAGYQFEATAETPAINTYSLDDHTLAIKSDGEWSASVEYEGSVTGWLELSATSGDKDTNITYKAKSPNEALTDRKAKIVLVSETHKAMGETVTYEVPITHRKYVFEVTPAASAINFAYTAVDVTTTRKALEVECSANWTVTCPSWVNVWYNGYGYGGSCEGSGDATLQFSVNNNLTSTSRSGKIVIKSVVGQFEYNITQEGYVFNIPNVNISTNALSGKSSAYTYTCSGDWYLQNCPEWVTFEPSRGDASPESRQFTVSYELNPKFTARDATVTFVASSGQTKEFKIHQNAYEFDSSAQSFSYEALNAPTNTINVVCTGGWSVRDETSKLVDWIETPVSNGSGNGSFTIKPKDNVVLKERRATLYVYSNDISASKAITIYQKPFVFDTAATTVNFGTLDTAAKSVTFDYIGGNEMTVSAAPNWLTVTTSSTASNYTIKFTPSKNTSADERTATITLTSKYNDGLKKVITVKQAGYVFSATPTSVSLKSGDTGANTITVKSTGKWTVATSATWLTLSSTGGTGDGSFTIKAAANTAKDAKDRSADVVITCSDDTSKKITIKVTQAKPE